MPQDSAPTGSAPQAGPAVRPPDRPPQRARRVSALERLVPLVAHWRLLIVAPLIAGLAALGLIFTVKPIFTARTTLLPPTQTQNPAAAALSSFAGAAGGLAGGALGIRSLADQYVALMQSERVQDQIIDDFKLMEVYEAEFRSLARRALSKTVRFSVGRKDGFITIEVDDRSPERAAAIANRHVEELRKLAALLAVNEAQARRTLFESQMKETTQRFTAAQQALQASGFNARVLRTEPRIAAEGYARLKAELTAAEVRLQAARQTLADGSPEVSQQLSALTVLRRQLAEAEGAMGAGAGTDYVSRYREFKYQETLLDLLSRQFELARLDEARQGGLIHVIDEARPPDRKSKPHRALVAVVTTLLTFVALVVGLLLRDSWRRASTRPGAAETVARLKAAWRGHPNP